MTELNPTISDSPTALEIHLYGSLRQAAGRKILRVKAGETLPLRGVLGRLLEAQPGLRPVLLDGEGRLLAHIHVIVNGQNVSFVNALEEILLTPGDALSLIPAIDGGGG
ncbi:MAG: MoaD/ThiS family protein [Anaerolineales bacterium]|nr:MoaD/ThiS family protein [Anaerolineales bacterium]